MITTTERRDEKIREATLKAHFQQQSNPEFYSLAEYVEALPFGTIFVDTDDLGRKTEMMRVWGGVIVNNGMRQGAVHYGDRWEDGYSIEVTHKPEEVRTEAKG